MIVHRAFRYELDPNDHQLTLLAKHAGMSRFAYNWALARRNELFEAKTGTDRFSNAMADNRAWNVWKHQGAPFWSEVSKCVAQEAFRDLDRSFSRFWKGRKEPRRVGYPKFRKKGRRDSFRVNGRLPLFPRHVQLPRIGRIRTKERTAVVGRVLSATITRVVDRWFVAIVVEEERPDVVPRKGAPVGIDVGLNTFAVSSDGLQLVAPKPLERSLDRLRLLSRRISRKMEGSRNRRKAIRAVAKLHRHVSDVRKDFLHKTTTWLAKTKPVIVIEDLAVHGLIRNRRLSRQVSDVAWGEFRRMLEYKADWYGMTLVIAPRFFASSKLCSSCGHKVHELPLSKRSWDCPACGIAHDRDLNAARNLAHYGTASRAETAGRQAGNACG